MISETVPLDDGGWRLPIEHRVVNRCIVDSAVSLEFHDGAQIAVVRIEGDFTIVENGRAFRLTPSDPGALGPAMRLFGRMVCSARTSAAGKLEVAFDDGRVMLVEPNDRYEAWEFAGPGGGRAVCGPGGVVSVWQPNTDSSSPA